MPTDSPIVVVNIIAMPYSGGTWVNLLLGSHEEACSIGEIDLINRGGIPICSLCGLTCPMWCSYRPGTNENIFHQLRRISGRRFLVVSNCQQFLEHQTHPGIETKFIRVMRDGRAAVASMLRQSPGRSVWRASRGWRQQMDLAGRFLASQPKQSVLRVSYDALASRDESELQRMCEFIGMTPDPAAFDHWIDEQHLLGGNPGTHAHLLRRRDRTTYHVVTRDGRFDQRELKEMSTGEAKAAADASPDDGVPRFNPHRWKDQLSRMQLRLFALAAGRLNRRFGYPSSLDRSAAPSETKPTDSDAAAPSRVPS